MKHKLEGSQWRARQEKIVVKKRLSVREWFNRGTPKTGKLNEQTFRPNRKDRFAGLTTKTLSRILSKSPQGD